MQCRISSSLCYFFQDVIRTIVQSGGIKHLVTMATSEHVIMQNEALVALALIAALELGEYPSTSLHLFPFQSVPKRSHWGRMQCTTASSFPRLSIFPWWFVQTQASRQIMQETGECWLSGCAPSFWEVVVWPRKAFQLNFQIWGKTQKANVP